jgi:BioD-like phosphotransacetylase family protein
LQFEIDKGIASKSVFKIACMTLKRLSGLFVLHRNGLEGGSSMSVIFIGTTGDRAGHSLLTWVLANRFAKNGLPLGFFKPFCTQPVLREDTWTDSDAYLFKTVLGLPEPLDELCPYLIPEEGLHHEDKGALLREIQSRVLTLLQKKEHLLLMGSRQVFFEEGRPGLPDLSLVKSLEADFILIHRYRSPSSSIYSILSIHSLIKEAMKGIIINRVPEAEINRVTQEVVTPLIKKGIPITATLQEDPVLSYRPLRDVVAVLQGEILCGGAGLDRMVGGYTAGSGDLKGPIRLFKRVFNKVVLLQPSQPDQEEGPHNTPRPVAGIILTGGTRPAQTLIEAARKAQMPLILVSEDTFTMMDRLEKVPTPLSPDDMMKARHFTEMLERDGALDRLLEACARP